MPPPWLCPKWLQPEACAGVWLEGGGALGSERTKVMGIVMTRSHCVPSMTQKAGSPERLMGRETSNSNPHWGHLKP